MCLDYAGSGPAGGVAVDYAGSGPAVGVGCFWVCGPSL